MTGAPRPSLTTLAGRTFDAIPPPALALLGILSVQLGSIWKHYAGSCRACSAS